MSSGGKAGRRLRTQDVALAASLGLERLPVHERLKVALLSTGDEVREPGAPLRQGQIWDANRFLLRNLLEGVGCDVSDLGILADDPEIIEGALMKAAGEHDLIVTSGGMSEGSEDHLAAIIRRRGFLEIRRLAIKPGKPVGIGDIDDCPILGLPGNPVAAAVAFLAFGRSFVLQLAGSVADKSPALRLRSAFSFEKRPGRQTYLMGVLIPGEGAPTSVRLVDRQGAAMLSRIGQADGFVVLDEETETVLPEDLVSFIPFDALFT